jgi:predicted PurR-regulated permease PerM
MARRRLRKASPPARRTGRQPDESRRHSGAAVVLLVAGVLLLGALSFAVYPSLSPFVLLGGLLFLLYPFRAEPVPRRLMLLGALFFTVWFFSSILGLLVPFLIALLIAYILNPLVSELERRRIPRWGSSLLLVVLLIGVVVAVGVFLVPVAVEQLQMVTERAGALAEEAGRALESGSLFNALGRFGISPEKAREAVLQQVTPKLEEILRRLFEALFGVVTGVTSVAQQILNIVIIPFVLFYLLKDFPLIARRGAMLVPARARDRVVAMAGLADALMGRYFRGAIAVALIQGTISGTALWLIGVEYAVMLGVMTFVLNFVPYVGLIVSLVVASIVALFSGGALGTKVLLVVVLYLGQKLLEATVLAPKIIGTQVGLHPVVLILCLLVFGYFLGFVGLLIAVPATALLIAGGREWLAVRRERGTAPDEA